MRKREKRTRKFTVRFTETEYKILEGKFRTTTSSQMSQYIRNAVLSRPLVIKYRNESLDQFMEELIQLKQELNAIGNNFNQAVKKLHTLKQIPEFRHWIAGHETTQQQLTERTKHIEERVAQMSEKWLQE